MKPFVSLPNLDDYPRDTPSCQVLIRHIFRMKDGCSDRNVEEDRIYLKSYAFDIIRDEARIMQLRYLDQVVAYTPLKYYSQQASDYENHHEFWSNHKDDDLNNYQPDELTYYVITVQNTVGCQHYVTTCQQQCPICYQFYSCWTCHNQDVDVHKFPRGQITILKCLKCGCEGAFSTKCSQCNNIFGEFSCLACQFLCFIGLEAKPFYHCDKCKSCRIGLGKNYLHCDTCKRCYHVSVFDKHRCNLDTHCMVCLEEFASSVAGSCILPCNHRLHIDCQTNMMQQGQYCCPKCKRLMFQQEKTINQYNKLFDDVNVAYIVFNQDCVYELLCNECNDHFYDYEELPYHACRKCSIFNSQIVRNNVDSQLLLLYHLKYPKQIGTVTFDNEQSILNMIKVLYGEDHQYRIDTNFSTLWRSIVQISGVPKFDDVKELFLKGE